MPTCVEDFGRDAGGVGRGEVGEEGEVGGEKEVERVGDSGAGGVEEGGGSGRGGGGGEGGGRESDEFLRAVAIYVEQERRMLIRGGVSS